MRKIIHLDMDCFYAAVEMRDHPFLRGKPVAVGGSQRRGVLTTCSYEARKFGCRSAMPTYKALQLCPELIVVPTRFDVYREAARQIRELMLEVTDLVEPLSLDEAFLDVTGHDRYAWDIARDLRARIYAQTELTASAGIAPNKLLAKIASDWKKPNGQFAIVPADIGEFMKPLAVGKLWGIGPKTNAKLAALGILTCGDVVREGPARLEEILGSWGPELFTQAQGIDNREVKTHRIRKSLSNERTFDESLKNEEQCQNALPRLFRELEDDLKKKSEPRKIAKLFVRLKFDDFQKTSRECVSSLVQIEEFRRLLTEALVRRQGRAVRLMGVGVRFAEISSEPEQLEFPFAF